MDQTTLLERPPILGEVVSQANRIDKKIKTRIEPSSYCLDVTVGYSHKYLEMLKAFVTQRKNFFAVTDIESFEIEWINVLRIYTKEAEKLAEYIKAEFQSGAENGYTIQSSKKTAENAGQLFYTYCPIFGQKSSFFGNRRVSQDTSPDFHLMRRAEDFSKNLAKKDAGLRAPLFIQK